MSNGIDDSPEDPNDDSLTGIDDSPEDPNDDSLTGIDDSSDDLDDDGSDDDDIIGSIDDDSIDGGGGDDSIDGDDGDDDINGGLGDDSLAGGLGDDTLHAGHGHDDLTGGTGNDIFSFYAVGNFIVHDFDDSSDLLNFESATTGLHDIEDLLEVISGIEDTSEGVTIHFINDIAAITLIGLHSDDLSANMVSFT